MLSDMACHSEKTWEIYIQNHMLGKNCFVLIYLYMLDILISRPDTGLCAGHGVTVGLRVSQSHYRSLLQISTNGG